MRGAYHDHAPLHKQYDVDQPRRQSEHDRAASTRNPNVLHFHSSDGQTGTESIPAGFALKADSVARHWNLALASDGPKDKVMTTRSFKFCTVEGCRHADMRCPVAQWLLEHRVQHLKEKAASG
jgi:hypothetical protein